MSEGQPPIRTIRATTIRRIVNVRDGSLQPNEPRGSIRTILQSSGDAFWTALSEEVRAEIEGGISEAERRLIQHFPEGHSSPLVARSREMSLLKQSELQYDPDTCSIIATANSFRILDGVDAAYTKTGIQSRIQQMHGARWTTVLPTTLRELTRSGEPFSKFDVEQILYEKRSANDIPEDFLKLLQVFEDGAVATLDWKISPGFKERAGTTTTHARTLGGFSVNQGHLFLHIIDPYKGTVDAWSFRDLVAAVGTPYGLNAERLSGIINAMARMATIISKKS